MGQSSPTPSMDRPLKSRWLSRHATAFQVMDLPPTPRLRSESNPSTPGRMVGMWRLGKSDGLAGGVKDGGGFVFWSPFDIPTTKPRLANVAPQPHAAHAPLAHHAL